MVAGPSRLVTLGGSKESREGDKENQLTNNNKIIGRARRVRKKEIMPRKLDRQIDNN